MEHAQLRLVVAVAVSELGFVAAAVGLVVVVADVWTFDLALGVVVVFVAAESAGMRDAAAVDRQPDSNG